MIVNKKKQRTWYIKSQLRRQVITIRNKIGKLSNLGLKKRNNTITLMLGELGTKKEELDQEHQMRNIDYKQAKQKNLGILCMH